MESLLKQIADLTTEVAALKKGKSPDVRPEPSRPQSHWRDEPDEWENPWGGRGSFRPPYTKVEFPKFDGGDPRGWILKAEKYFRYYQTPEESKVDVAAMYLEGDALDLFAWVNSERTLLYWEELVKILQEQYGPAEFQNPDEYLGAVKQTGTVQEYRLEFAKRAARVKNWPEHCLLGIFLNGLKEELKADVRIHKPRSVYKAVSLALEYETKLGSMKTHKAQSFSAQNTKLPTQNRSPTTHSQQRLPPGSSQNTSSSSASVTQPQNSWDLQRQSRRENGLCFRCGERFYPGHRCKKFLTSNYGDG